MDARLRAQTPAYLVAVLDADKLPPDVFYEIRDANDVIPDGRAAVAGVPDPHVARRFDPVFAPWHALAALPPETFAAKAPDVLSRLADDADEPAQPARRSPR